MIDVISTVQVVLREANFTTRLVSLDRSPVVCFEDDVISGFGRVFEDPEALLSGWRATEMSLLKFFASSFRFAGDKAWNVYCIFLCSRAADPIQNRQVRWVEEDLARTRKIAACGVGSRDDIVRVLLPILPLQQQPVLRAEDLTKRLETRIRTIAPKASAVVLDEEVSPAEVARLLGAPS